MNIDLITKPARKMNKNDELCKNLKYKLYKYNIEIVRMAQILIIGRN